MLPLQVYTCWGKAVYWHLSVLRPYLHSIHFVSGALARHQCLGIELVTDVPQDRSSRFLSACLQLETCAGPSPTWTFAPLPVGDCLAVPA